MKSIIFLLLSVLTVEGYAQQNPKFLNVLAVNGLNIRSKPEAQSRVLTKAAYGKRVEVLQKTKVELQLGWVNDHWYKVRYRGREGYVFGGYLTELKPPAEIKSKHLVDVLPLYCTQVFEMNGAPIETKEVDVLGDTLQHTLIRFTNGSELELESDRSSRASKLILSASIQDAYVLVEALLKQSGFDERLNDLRFVKGSDGKLLRVSSGNSDITINTFSNDRVAIQFLSGSE
jgi:hypothetical protein